MAYFLDEDKKEGEIATFTSPKICEYINIGKMIDKEEITGLTISFLGKEFFVYVDKSFLERYNISSSITYLEINENGGNLMDLFLELKPIRPSILKKYMDSIGGNAPNRELSK